MPTFVDDGPKGHQQFAVEQSIVGATKDRMVYAPSVASGVRGEAGLKRCYTDVYHNCILKHMKRHVNEFTFRLNDCNVTVDTQTRLDALFKAMPRKNVIYKVLIAQ